MIQITRYKFDMAKEYLTLAEACRELRENAHIRSVGEVLAQYVGIDKDDRDMLAKKLRQALAEVMPDASPDLIRKNVNNWLKVSSISIKKESAVQLAFALGLEYSLADKLIMSLCGERLHWRDPKDIVYGFALNTGRTYMEALSIYGDLKQKGIFDFANNDTETFTESIEYDLLRITSAEMLEQYLFEHRSQLGNYHNTALDMIDQLMQILRNPSKNKYDKGFAVDENATLQEIVVRNLYGDIIPRIRRTAESKNESKFVLDTLQKSIRAGWPEETTLSKMGTHSTDASRKTLMLLFLATDGGDSVYADWRGEDVSREEVFEDRVDRLSTMLVDCGYAPLDPRALFDWIVLFCLCDEESFIADDKMREFLRMIFEGNTE